MSNRTVKQNHTVKFGRTGELDYTTESQVIDGEIMDTKVLMKGEFIIAGHEREKFYSSLEKLIDKFFI